METANPEKPTSIRQLSKPSPKSIKVEVWDLFIRLFHWSLVISFSVAYASGDGWRGFHLFAGYAALALIAGRLLWGVIGTKYARFAHFVTSPKKIVVYVRDVLNRRDARYLGHNPAGGAMIVVMLVLLAAVSVSGVLLTTDAFWGSEAMDMIHRVLANITVFCIVAHVLGVVFTSISTKENLIWSMMSGRKRAPRDRDIS